MRAITEAQRLQVGEKGPLKFIVMLCVSNATGDTTNLRGWLVNE